MAETKCTSRWIRTRVELGIRKAASGSYYQAYVGSGEYKKFKHFPPDTPLAHMRQWRKDTADKLAAQREHDDRVKLRATIKPLPHIVEFPAAPSYVYFIQGAKHVKIGFATDPLKRFGELQVSHFEQLRLVAVVPGDRDLEKRLHAHFRDQAVRGEWFRLDSSVQWVIGKLGFAAESASAQIIGRLHKKSRAVKNPISRTSQIHRLAPLSN